MNKKNYEKPKMEIIELDNQDVITTSDDPIPGGGGNNP
jgi:hypothetical protein